MVKDYFSQQSADYSRFRPGYPDALFDFLCTLAPSTALAWDCATGNGQAARALAARMERVVATDLSAAQLAEAPPQPRVLYAQALAEAAPLPDASVDLVTVAQALHWFDFEPFYRELARVLTPRGLFAAWTYSFLEASPQLGAAVDAAVRAFYHDVIGPYWPPERRWVDDRYRSIPFPLTAVEAPEFSIELEWDRDGMLGYLGSWSAVARYRAAGHADPLPALAAAVARAWPDGGERRGLRWPL
ncbi:MAG: class I SAM-dependent methyltransferase, partial [Gammaproteobacteria bacterium]